MRRYPKYKDSGVEWLGKIPAHWEVKRLRHVASLNPLPNWRALEQQAEYPFFPMEAIGESGELDRSRRKLLDECRTGYTYFAEGDVTYAKVTPCFENGKGAVIRDLDGGHGFGTTELTVLRPIAIDRDYLFAMTSAESFRRPAAAEMLGSGGLKRVPDEFARNYLAAIPPAPEQVSIAAALNRETARIDALIEKKTRFVELLKEKRQALITHAVTKGLDCDVKMKDSGVEWIGEVPEHWDVARVKHVARQESGHTPDKKNPEFWEDCRIPWVSLKDSDTLRNVDYIYNTDTCINERGLAGSSARILPKGTVVFTRDATVGLCAITARPMAVSQHLIGWVYIGKLNPEFLLRVFEAMAPWLDSRTAGATIKTIGMDDIGALMMPYPPMSEQIRIAAHLQLVKESMKRLIELTERSISLLKERRGALITAAVTGQIDLREEAA